MVPRKKLAILTAGVLVPVLLIAISMSLALAGEGEFDVGVFKADDPSYVTAGESLSYTITVTNSQWGITATNVQVTDILPSEVEYVDDTDSCVESSPGTLSCTLGDLAPGEETSFIINVDVAPDAYDYFDGNEICNSVEVSATTQLGGPDTNLANNDAEECTWVDEVADLTMQKMVFPGDVVPVGEWFSYTMRTENLGPSTSRYPVMMDWFATDGSITVMPSHQEREEGMCGPMPTDQGWAETPAWLMTWVNSICGVLDIPFCGDPYFWMDAWWYYWYHNFPPMYPYPLAVDWMCVWGLWDLDPGEGFERTVEVLPLDAQTIYNQAWVLPDLYPIIGMDGFDGFDGFEYYGTYDPDIFNNVDELVTHVTDEADLIVTKVSKPDDQVDAGLPFTYTIFVENLGPAPATEVSIRDEILSSGDFEIWDVILDPLRDDEGPIELPSPEGGMTFEFHLLEPLEPKGPDLQGRWVIQMVLGAAETQDVNNMVEVFTREGGSFDPDLSNNQDEDRIAVGDVANLGINKWWDAMPPEWFDGWEFTPEDCYVFEQGPVAVRAGCPFRFMLEVWNDGPSMGENVVVEDVLPAGVTVDGVGAPGSCTTGIPGDPAAPLICNLGNIPAGEGAGFEIYVWAHEDLAWELLENDALIYSDIFDPDNGNNRAHTMVWVEPFSYLYLEKDGPPEIWAGEEIEYWIHLRNEGPSTAHDVYLDDELPGGVSLLDAQVMIGDGSCQPNSTLCSLGDVQPHEGRSVRVRGYVEPWLEGGTLITNTVRAWAQSPFYQPVFEEPISATWETLVHSAANLSIHKTGDPYKVYAGEQKRYDIEVTNHGPGVAYNVIVSDTLDPGVEFEIATVGCDIPMTMLGSTQPTETDTLFSVDLGSGAGTYIGDMPEWLAAEIEYDNTSGRLFASMGFKPWYEDLNGIGEPRLYELDPTTGAEIGYVELSEDCALPGLEFLGGTLFGACNYDRPSDDGMPYLVTVNPDTGEVHEVDSGPIVDDYGLIHGLAWDEVGRVMYGLWVTEGPNALVTLDLDTGEGDFLCEIWDDDYSEPINNLRAIEFGPDGQLYGGIAEDSDLVIIDPTPMENNGEYCHMHHVGDTGYSVTGLTLMGGSEVECHLGEIPPGESSAFSMWVRVKPDTLGYIHNRVFVHSETWDPDEGNNEHDEWNLVLGKADLKLTKFGKPDGVVRAGEELEYWVIVDNLGTGFAHDVILYDIIASDGEFALWWEGMWDGEENGAPFDCWVQENGCYEDNGYYVCEEDAQLTCRLNHPLPVMSAESPGRWLLKVWVEAWEEQSINNVAHVVSSDFDPDPSNNQAMAEHDITAVADLDLYKEATGEVLVDCDDDIDWWQDEVAAGGMLEYNLYIHNRGPSEAENVVVEDWGISPFLDIVEVECNTDSGDDCDCNTSDLGELGDEDRRLTCYLGTMEYDVEDYITIIARVPSDVPEGTLLVNDAMVYSDIFDDDNGDNLVTNWTTVIRTADLMVEKTQEPEIALPGWDITYSVTVTNLGLSDAEGVFITDTIPVQLLDPEWTCCASDGGDCDVQCEPPVCPEGPCEWPDPGLFAQADIPAGEWVIYTITGTLDWWPCGPFTNTVEVIAPEDMVHEGEDIDPCDENNVDIAVNDPFCHFDPLVLKAFPGPDSPP